MIMFDKIFKLKHHRTTIAKECRAGLATFLTMAYIIVVNPSILSQAITLGSDQTFVQLLSATAIAAAIGCFLMGLIANYPFALAPGMWLNAFFTFNVVLGQGISWQQAMGASFISGCLFVVLSSIGVRKIIVEAIPPE